MSISVPRWLDDNKDAFAPPVCNKMLHNDGQLKVMFVGGPNVRRDYHVEEGEELFYQVRGDMCLKIMERGAPKDVVIREGELFVLPARIPHSPQRFADTMGLVVERDRLPSEVDGLRWYTDDGRVLYEEWFPCADLGTQVKDAIGRFFASEAAATGEPGAAGAEQVPCPVHLDTATEVMRPVPLREWVRAHADELRRGAVSVAPTAAEFDVALAGACGERAYAWPGEVFLWQMRGTVRVHVREPGAADARTVELRDGDSLLVPAGSDVREERGDAAGADADADADAAPLGMIVKTRAPVVQRASA